jgi:hypothetical protein
VSGEDPIDVAWQQVLGSWGEEAAHKRFIALAQSLGRLGDAGRRYREVRESPEGDGPYRDLTDRREIAKKRIDEILGVAMVAMAATKTPPPSKKHPKLTFLAIGVCAGMVLFALWAYLSAQ